MQRASERWPRTSLGRAGRIGRREEGARDALRRLRDDHLFNLQSYSASTQRVLCLGDSHVKVMRHVRVPGVWFLPLFVDGATASGIANPNSATRSVEIFNRRLQQAKPWQKVLLQLGEVDCGFVIWHRAQRHDITVSEQLEETLDSYTSFLDTLTGRRFVQVIVLSAPAPTIVDDRDGWGAVANLRSAITATQRERTDLTVAFNDELRARCASRGVTFVDVTTQHIDPGTGLIAPQYVRESTDDHHLADEPYAALIGSALSPILARPGTG